MVIKALLGGGPIPGSFACRKEIIDNGNEMIAAVERVRKLKLKPTMDEFLKAKADWEAQAKPMPKQPYQP
jgi:hypothetical protein